MKVGTSVAIVIAKTDRGHDVSLQLRIGRVERPHGSPVKVTTELEAWIEVGRLADERIARAGLDATK